MSTLHSYIYILQTKPGSLLFQNYVRRRELYTRRGPGSHGFYIHQLQHNKILLSTKQSNTKPLPGSDIYTRVEKPTLRNYIHDPQTPKSSYDTKLPNPGTITLPGFSSNPRKPKSHKHLHRNFKQISKIKTEAPPIRTRIHIQKLKNTMKFLRFKPRNEPQTQTHSTDETQNTNNTTKIELRITRIAA